ncbi:hypothetical protein F511_06392 [Dorcoceras hygrometricum]|uniref:Multicopper oxidase LPR1-like n=1 Tax=Dorcoceras hygrometricum TaxID=472368 RepID=A0A2Z7ADT2_9LAMI|nr:hypothetical protein F511_06392 [Dorcoceras hygrometricum]
MVDMCRLVFTFAFIFVLILLQGLFGSNYGGIIDPSALEMFVDELPDMPRIKGFDIVNGVRVTKSLDIGMFHKTWKFHRDLPPTPVFAYGLSQETATVPGPTIETLQGIHTYITWRNYLPSKHILPWDPTIPTAMPHSSTGIPTVVHLHGGIDEPQSDGHANAWFTAGFRDRGPSWTKEKYHYDNMQHPGTLWYHDHAMGLTRVNILAGLFGAYIIRQPSVELTLQMPYEEEFDRPLLMFDRNFNKDGSIFMNSTGNNPSIHPQWRPEYFADVIIVNGKAWPYMIVRRRRYRFRIINTSNARFFSFYFDNGLEFIHIGSDSAYNNKPIRLNKILLAPSEIAVVLIDFTESNSSSATLCNDAPYPFPSGDQVNKRNSKIMKFIITAGHERDTTRLPTTLIKYPPPNPTSASITRYIVMYEYTSNTDEPTHMYINAKPFEAPVTETPKVGATEIWTVINLTEDTHPLHIHLGLILALNQTKVVGVDEFKSCMMELNDATKCKVDKYVRGETIQVPAHEKGWKNVYKMMPGCETTILVRFSYIHSNESYPFDATAEPGYIYHCHVSDISFNMFVFWIIRSLPARS